jgi:SH3-like domain-containing protein
MGILLISVLYGSALNALCIKVPVANLRTGPGTEYEIGWTVYKYMPFKIVGRSISGVWYAVEDIDGAVLWIHKKLVTNKYRCAVVNVNEVNVRTGPGTNYSKCFSEPVDKYYSARILKKKGPWVKFVDEDKTTGWIHEDYIWVQ